MVDIESKELKDFVKATIESIEEGLKEGYELKGDIEFELAVVTKKGAGAGLKIFVVDASGKYEVEHVSKFKFKIGETFEPGPARVFLKG